MDKVNECIKMYSSLFSEPRMSEEFLIRPTFMYLRDIFKATMKKTGFGRGLIPEKDLSEENVFTPEWYQK